MTVHELNTNELNELRESYFYQLQESAPDVLEDINQAEDILMSNVKQYYEDIDFVKDDFFCNQEQQTKVIFKYFKNTDEVIALFPDEPWSDDTTITSYLHVGQHGAASKDLIDELPDATPEQYKSLLEELKSIGYDNLLDITGALPFKTINPKEMDEVGRAFIYLLLCEREENGMESLTIKLNGDYVEIPVTEMQKYLD